MGRIKTYTNDGTISDKDYLLGGDADNLDATKTYLLEDVRDYVLQETILGPGITGPQGVQGPAGPIGPVGPAGLTWRGAWTSGTSYIANDAVGYNGASWFCILATSGTTTPNLATTNWALLASQGAQGIQGVQGPTGPSGPAGSAGSGTLQQAFDNGKTMTTSNFTAAIFQLKPGLSVKNTSTLDETTVETTKVTFTKNQGGLKTTNLFQAVTPTVNRAVYLPDADGTIALKTYNETVILLSYNGTNFTYTNVINELGVTITFSVLSGTLYCTLSSNVLTSGKTIVWAGSFVEFGGYLSAGNRASNNIATISLINTNGTNNTFPTSFTDLPVRIQVYN